MIPGAFVSSAQAFTEPDNSIQLTYEGCRYYDGITLPNSDGDYICPDDAYTTGNLGKGWNELDLVPYRLTATNSSSDDDTFNVYIGADSMLDGVKGYDVISVPELAEGSSDGCVISALDPASTDDATGGTSETLYRELTLTVPAGGECEINWYSRLALGSSQWPGSSLQTYLFESEDFTKGKRTIPIPVEPIQAPTVDKDMTATRGSSYLWSLSKTPSQAVVNIDNTCEFIGDTGEVPVTVEVEWTRTEADPETVTISTTVYATNPAARDLTVNVTDRIYSGQGQDAADLLDTKSATDVPVPANTANVPVLAHTFEWDGPADAEFVNDVATVEFLDGVTEAPIAELTTSEEAGIQKLEADDTTATITDSEEVTGPGDTQFAVADPESGSFDGYTPGDRTAGPVDWTSDEQEGSGSVLFEKTLYFSKGTSGTGELTDTATLTGSNGFTTTTSATIALVVDTTATLTIDKSIPAALTGDETATFTFDVTNAQDVVVANDVPIAFSAADGTTDSVEVPNLEPGVYTVTENTPPEGWVSTTDPQTVDLSGATCAGTAAFANARVAPVVLGTVTIVKEFNPLDSGFTGAFDVAYSCVNGATTVTSGTAALTAGQSTTVPNLPLGTTCTVTEPTLPTPPEGWEFLPATFVPANGQVTVSDENRLVEVRVVNGITQVNPAVASRPCPVDVQLVKPKPKKVGKKVVLIKGIKTRETRCELVRPAVVCVPLGPTASGETAFCRTFVNRRTGRVVIKADGYEAIRVTVRVKARPKPAYRDTYDSKTWRKSWTLR